MFGHPPSRCSAQATPHRGNALIAAPWPSPDAPVDEAAAAQFGALQCQITFGNHEPDKHKPGFIKYVC